MPWWVRLSWLGTVLQRSWVGFLVRAHSWVVGLVPGRGAYERQLINVSLITDRCFSPSLFPSLPLSLKINKIFKKEYPIKIFTLHRKINILCPVKSKFDCIKGSLNAWALRGSWKVIGWRLRRNYNYYLWHLLNVFVLHELQDTEFSNIVTYECNLWLHVYTYPRLFIQNFH